MFRIAFVDNIWFFKFGIMYLSSALKKEGYHTELFLYDGDKKLLNDIIRYSPDMVAFSISTGSQQWALELAQKIKSLKNITVIAGGPHPTFYPDIINEGQMDAICRGEGEKVVVDFVNCISQNVSCNKVNSFWVKDNGAIFKNEIAPLEQDIDKFDFPDRKIYEKYKIFRNPRTQTFFVLRGCPFKCSYCFNHNAMKIYESKGKFLRIRRVEAIIEEIKSILHNNKPQNIRLYGDTFTVDREWCFSFLPLYAKEIGIPFITCTRVDTLDEELIKELKKAGCCRISFGVESGDERIRINLLKKNTTNIQHLYIAHLLHKYGIQFSNSNMFVLPTERLNNAFKTVGLNMAMKPKYLHSQIFQPYPNLKLTSLSIEKKISNEESFRQIKSLSIFQSVLNQQEIKDIKNLQKLFFIAVRFPNLNYIVRFLLKIKPNILFNYIFIVYQLKDFVNTLGLSYREAFYCSYKMRGVFRESMRKKNFKLEI